MLLQTLKSVCWDAVPPKIQVELTLFNKTNLRRNLVFTGELLQLVALFQQNAIPIAALKGPVLAHSIYGHISLREFSDLDVVVNEADLCKAESILTARGYQADFADRDYRSAFLSYQGQYAFRHPETEISVDLHWRLSDNLRSAEIWSRLEQVTIAGRTISTLAHDDLTLFLAAHGTKEGWRDLIWVCDFAEVLRNCSDVDWGAVLDRARRVHCSRQLLLAIFLATSLLDAPAPVELIDKARNDSAIQSLAKKAQLRMLRSAPEGELAEFLNGLNTDDRLTQRLRRVVISLTTRTVGDYKAMPLPKSFWGLYYFIRPLRLAGKLPETIRQFNYGVRRNAERVSATNPQLARAGSASTPYVVSNNRDN